MYLTFGSSEESILLQSPETGMGYQVIEATKINSYTRQKFIVLNAELAIEMDNEQNILLGKVFTEGMVDAKSKAIHSELRNIKVLSKPEFRAELSVTKSLQDSGAIDSPEENADGKEIFVRLSAFQNDRRVDKINKSLLPGSYTTTENDYKLCKSTGADPIDRYALPNNMPIQWAFYIVPVATDLLQRGIVQPANGKAGGGKEVYFDKGTSINTFTKETPY
jgi:hypothetical protein